MVILTWSCMHWSGNFCPPQFGARAVDWLAGQLETLASRNGNSHPCQHHHHQCSLCQMRSFMIFLWGTVHAEEEQSCVVLGMGLGGLTYQPVQQLAKITNFEYRFDIVLSIVVVPNGHVVDAIAVLVPRTSLTGCKWVRCLGGWKSDQPWEFLLR